VAEGGVLVHNAGALCDGAGDAQYAARQNEQGLTVRAEGTITGPHPGRVKKSYRPEPVGGRASGHHRGHLVPEGMVDSPDLVNVKSNFISEASHSNLGPKRSFEKLAGRIAEANPDSVVKTIHFPRRMQGETVPYAVIHFVTVDGVAVHGVRIPNI